MIRLILNTIGVNKPNVALAIAADNGSMSELELKELKK
jgi:hypothetical protein